MIIIHFFTVHFLDFLKKSLISINKKVSLFREMLNATTGAHNLIITPIFIFHERQRVKY
jgi:hypothetical protein